MAQTKENNEKKERTKLANNKEIKDYGKAWKIRKENERKKEEIHRERNYKKKKERKANRKFVNMLCLQADVFTSFPTNG